MILKQPFFSSSKGEMYSVYWWGGGVWGEGVIPQIRVFRDYDGTTQTANQRTSLNPLSRARLLRLYGITCTVWCISMF